tara:strand:+ start:1929 stop:3344 length:1416 start_codon:yes stop_codon:yes gene_type:complete
MNYVFLDLEASGASTAFDSVLEIYAKLVDDEFNELDEFHGRARLKEGVIPNLTAVMEVCKISANTLKNTNTSNFQLLVDAEKKFKSWGKVIYFGYNSTNYDIEVIRKWLFKSLKEPYLTNTKGNKQGDILNIIRSAKLLDDKIIKTQLSEKKNPIFKLDQLLPRKDSHGAKSDTIACESLGKLVYSKNRNLWNSYLDTLSREGAENFIKKEKVFCNLEWFYGRLRLFAVSLIGFHKVWKWGVAWDLSQSPEDYFNLSKNDLKAALKKAPKATRMVRTNKSLVLLKSEHALTNEVYKKIGLQKLISRADMLQSNQEFKQRILDILEEEANEKMQLKEDKPNLQPEETIYNGKFADEKEKKLMEDFHNSSWEDKIKFIGKFNENKYNYFAAHICYEERPDLLESTSNSIYKNVKRDIAKKIFSDKNENWTTVGDFMKQIDDARAKYENDPSKLKQLEEYNDLVMDIQKKYEGV